jgi:hypothetical protein
VWVPHSSTHTQASWGSLPRLPSSSRRPSRTRRVLRPIFPLFPGGVHPLCGPAHTVERLTSKEATTRRGTRTSLLQSDERALLYVLFEQLASSSLLARSSSLGFEPGLFLGAIGHPRRVRPSVLWRRGSRRRCGLLRSCPSLARGLGLSSLLGLLNTGSCVHDAQWVIYAATRCSLYACPFPSQLHACISIEQWFL